MDEKITEGSPLDVYSNCSSGRSSNPLVLNKGRVKYEDRVTFNIDLAKPLEMNPLIKPHSVDVTIEEDLFSFRHAMKYSNEELVNKLSHSEALKKEFPHGKSRFKRSKRCKSKFSYCNT